MEESMTGNETDSILVVVSDLFFREKIAAAARELGVVVHFARSGAKGLEAARLHGCRKAFIDLHLKSEDPLPVGELLKREGGVDYVGGYFSHVDSERGEEAMARGFDETFPRSKFFARRPELLGR
jgi:CheY-like chemotaxis protein